MNRKQYKRRLKKMGWVVIGHGCFATVFMHPDSENVIKVAENDAWPEYIKNAKENRFLGKYAPNVKRIVFKEDFYVALIETLIETSFILNNNLIDSKMKEKLAIACTYDHKYNMKTKFKKTFGVFGKYIQTMRDKEYRTDFGHNNFMFRYNGKSYDLVFNDPFYSGNHSFSKNSKIRLTA